MNIRHLLVLFASFAISVLTMSAHSGDDSVQAAKDRETYGSPELMQNVYGRDYELLNGKWDAIIDLYDLGRSKQLWLNRKPETKTEFFEYSFDGGLRLNVPGDFNSQIPQLQYYEGTVWYARHFSASPACAGERLFLYFGAVNNRRSTDAIPAMSFDWWNYGGITRDVMLVRTPQVYIKDYFIQLDRTAPDVINASVRMSAGVPEGSAVVIDIPELKCSVNVALDATGRGSKSFKVKKLQRWSPDSPKLYDIHLSYLSGAAEAGDSISEKIGFRNITVDGTRILVNGSPTFMRGVSFHEEIPQRMGRAFSEADAWQLLSEAKELGVNMVRLAHYPQNEYTGWYAPWPVEPSLCRWNVVPDKPVIISEFGCEALYGQRGNAEWAGSWSEDYQAANYLRNLEMFEQIPNLAGVSPWVLYDFRSPYRFHPTNQDGWNRKGLVSDQGQRKKAWYVMHDYYMKMNC